MNRMRMGFRLGILLVAAASLVARAQESPAASTAEAREIQVSAKKYEFNPSVISVKQGEHIKLIITATDRDHGFKCDAFKIDRKLKKGQPATVEFTADQAGDFPFHCSTVCGIGHHRMKGGIVVEKAP